MRWFFTRHALARIGEMGVERDEVLAALNDPDVSWPSERGPRTGGVGGGHQRTAVRDRLAVVYDEHAGKVITVLWNSATTGREGRGSVNTT